MILKTRSTAAFVLLKGTGDRAHIVGYAHSAGPDPTARARRLGAKLVPIVDGEVEVPDGDALGIVTDRLFRPPGPAVTPTERADRRAGHERAQGALFDPPPAGSSRRCAVCAGPHLTDACPKATALTLGGATVVDLDTAEGMAAHVRTLPDENLRAIAARPIFVCEAGSNALLVTAASLELIVRSA